MGLQMRELEIRQQAQLEKLRLEQELQQERQLQKERTEMEERVQKERMEMEKRERKRKTNADRKEKLKFAELIMKEQELQNKTVKPQPLDFGIHFDVTKHIRLVPLFQEKEVDKYFLHFKKSSRNFKMAKGALDYAFAKCYNWEGC